MASKKLIQMICMCHGRTFAMCILQWPRWSCSALPFVAYAAKTPDTNFYPDRRLLVRNEPRPRVRAADVMSSPASSPSWPRPACPPNGGRVSTDQPKLKSAMDAHCTAPRSCRNPSRAPLLAPARNTRSDRFSLTPIAGWGAVRLSVSSLAAAGSVEKQTTYAYGTDQQEMLKPEYSPSSRAASQTCSFHRPVLARSRPSPAVAAMMFYKRTLAASTFVDAAAARQYVRATAIVDKRTLAAGPGKRPGFCDAPWNLEEASAILAADKDRYHSV